MERKNITILAFLLIIITICLIAYFIYKNSHSTREKVSKTEDYTVVENYPQTNALNVLYTDQNGNLGATSDLGIQNLTVMSDSKFNGSQTVSGTQKVIDKIDTPSINRIGGDWLRVNDNGTSVGKTALYGKLAINEDRTGGGGGLVVGDWDHNPGKGNIKATGNITSDGNLNVGGRVNLSNGWNIRTNDGHFRLYFNDSLQFSVHNPNAGDEWKNVVWGNRIRSEGELRANGNIRSMSSVILNDSGKLWADGNAFQFQKSNSTGAGCGGCRRAYWWNGSVDNCYGCA